ncbi:transcriptional regulator [Gluconacetobacter sp. 1b LMG 1731]|uniref:Transcriptional regulator n=1 Tax=Gluconacetobacter dulcium TaxID=2729096 RepID=A0A7W4IKI9_9PROT|nr:transcriptional regulator [Gluconacetobacter dulcium]MBB2164527.1 transcriptional regulator [Gluconacetobacter dulcium]MBB2193706.1 transcriptional regulator [Gluconacetobacter dulcium]
MTARGFETVENDLEAIGWGLRQVSRRSGFSRARITRLKSTTLDHDGSPAERAFRRWIADLARLHRRFYSPLSPAVPAPGNRPCLNGAGVNRALIIIGWSERFLAESLAMHRTELRRVLENGGELSPRPSRWLDVLCDGHIDLPRPDVTD